MTTLRRDRVVKFELMDGKVRYVPMERVLIINEHSESGMSVAIMDAKGEKVGFRCVRFQLVKQGTWYN